MAAVSAVNINLGLFRFCGFPHSSLYLRRPIKYEHTNRLHRWDGECAGGYIFDEDEKRETTIHKIGVIAKHACSMASLEIKSIVGNVLSPTKKVRLSHISGEGFQLTQCLLGVKADMMLRRISVWLVYICEHFYWLFNAAGFEPVQAK